MKDKTKKVLRKLVSNPWLDLSVGIILFLSGILEVWETLPEDIKNFNVKASHGVVIFGFVMALKAFTDIFAGLEFIDEANKIEKEEKQENKKN